MKQKLLPFLFFAVLLAVVVAVVVDKRASVAARTSGECGDECMAYMPWQVKPLPSPTPTLTPTPTATPTALPLDFTVTDIEIFQATQTDNNTVPLVAGKTAVARIYAQTLTGTSPNNVQVSLSAVRNGNNLGTINASGPTTVPGSPAHGAYNSTYNVILPDNWLSGQVQLTAKVDATEAYFELNEGNNQFGRSVTFNDVPDLQIRLIPIDYVHTGPTNQGDYPGQSVDNISDWISRAYPMGTINVQIRAPYTFVGNLETNLSHWEGLLNEMYLLKLSDGLPEDTPIVYYGFIPIQNGSEQWFSGSGVAGIGYISDPGEIFRESLGLNLASFGEDFSGILAGHEIGHNLGRYHAPCGGAAGADPNYPYGGASIGQYGTDIDGNAVSFYAPASHVDVMSYCAPEWMSDYTYIGLYNNQRTYGLVASAQTADHLVIRAAYDENGAKLAPTYAFSVPARTTAIESEVVVELLDSNGAIMAKRPVSVREAEEEGIRLRAIMGSVPLPNRPVAAMRLVENGMILTEQIFSTPQNVAEAILSLNRATNGMTLSWSVPNIPAIIRYTADDGETWTTFAVDVQGGTFTVPTAELTADGRFEVILANTGAPTILTADFTHSP